MSEIFDWAKNAQMQPEPITVEIWKRLPEEFCRQVEVVGGQAVRCESPSPLQRKVTRWLVNMLELAAARHGAETEECLGTDVDFDVVLWELPRVHIRRPDVVLYRRALGDEKPLPAHMVLLAVEVVSSAGRVDTVDKRAEYAAAEVPWYWIVRLHHGGVSDIEVLALDHAIGGYRLVSVLEPGDANHTDGPIRIDLDWVWLGATD